MTSEADHISSRLCQYLREHVVAPQVDINERVSLLKAGMDSVALVELLLFIEREMGVSIPDEALTPELFDSVGALAERIVHLRAAAPDSAMG